jgi:hypothetical protein
LTTAIRCFMVIVPMKACHWAIFTSQTFKHVSQRL